MDPIFSYIDYRLFLRDYYAEQKRTTRYFSYRYFAGRCGINSPNFLKQVIEGKRNLTIVTSEKFVAALKLTDKEARFFHYLVLFNQAGGAKEKQDHYAVLLSMMHTVREQQLTADQHEYYNKWYTSVIRELVCLRNFHDDYSLLAKNVMPPIKPSQAKEAVKLLVKLGLIRKTSTGAYCQTQTALLSQSELARMAVRAFNREMLLRAVDALDTVPRNQRNILGVTLGVSQACFDVLVAEMQAFRDRVVTIVNNDKDAHRVYQMNLQLFPVSNDVKLDTQEVQP